MTTEFYINRKKLLKGIAMAVIFIVFGITVCVVALQEGGGGWIMIPIGMVPILAGCITILLNMKRWNDKKPGLVLDRRGITINTNSFNDGFIPWQDVLMIYSDEFRGVMNVGLKEPEHYISKLSFFKRLILKWNYKQNRGVVYISPRILDCTYRELLECTAECFNRYLSETNNPA